MTMLPRIVLPAVATLGVLYPTTFLMGMWKSAENGDIDAPGQWVSGGDIASGWRYDVFERAFPKTYRMDMSASEKGLGSMCILEVRNGPKPISATSGGGPLVYVTLEHPLASTGQSRIMLDMGEVDRARCAGVITDGQLFAGGAASSRFAEAKEPKAPLRALDESDAEDDPALAVQAKPRLVSADASHAMGM